MSTKPVSLLARDEETLARDHARLIALWEAAGLPYKLTGRDSLEAFARQQAGGQQTVLGVEAEDGKLIGAVIATHDGRKGWINRLAVHPDYRRQGIGRQLITAAEDALKAQGMTVIAALIEPENEVSLAVFIAAGYVEWPGLHYVSKRESKDS